MRPNVPFNLSHRVRYVQTVTAIRWLDLNGKTFEDMNACLLSHLNPKVRRIDGSGGDGGRDCQFDAPGGLHAYQIKHFLGGRMGKAQRQQVIDSLKTVLKLNPVAWELIVPFDHTPSELEWFEGLPRKLGLPFPIEWRGKTWLDLQFAQRRFIYDYFEGTTHAEVIEILRELQKDQAALANGVPDAMDGVKALVLRANTLDPHYRFAIFSDGATTQVRVIPAYVGAEEDRPIHVKGEFLFDMKTEEGRAKEAEFERAMDFGTPVQLDGKYVPEFRIDAPAGLGQSVQGPSVEMGPGKPVTEAPLDLVYTISNPEGAAVASLTLTHMPETSGFKGTVVRAKDRAGYVESEVTINVKEGKFGIKFHAEWNRFVPHDFAPIARFLAEYHTPNAINVARPDGTALSEPFPCSDDITIPQWAADFISNVAMIQAAAGVVREVSGQITSQDAANADGGVALLRGKEVAKPWVDSIMTLAPTAPLETRRRIAETTVRFETTIEAPVLLDICGATYPVGKRYRMRGAAVVHPSSRAAILADPLTSDVAVRLVPDPKEPAGLCRLLDEE